MVWIVVTGVDSQSKYLHAVGVDSETYKVCMDYGWMHESSLVQVVNSAGANGKPLNFSVIHNTSIMQDCGAFTRFSKRGSAVILAEMQDKRHKTTGYMLLSCTNNATVVLPIHEILQLEANMPDGEHFLQNGIVRNNSISCYPNKPFACVVSNEPSRVLTIKEMANRVLSGEMHLSVDGNLERGKLVMREMTLIVDQELKQDRTQQSQPLEPFGASRKTSSRMANMLLWSLQAPTLDDKVKLTQVVGKTSKDVTEVMLDHRFSKKYCGAWDEFLIRNKDAIMRGSNSNGAKAGTTQPATTGVAPADTAKKNVLSEDKKEDLISAILSGKGPSAKSSDRARLTIIWHALLDKLGGSIRERNDSPQTGPAFRDVENQAKNAFIWILSSKDNDFIFISLNEYRELMEDLCPAMMDLLYSDDFDEMNEWFDKNQQYVLNAVDDYDPTKSEFKSSASTSAPKPDQKPVKVKYPPGMKEAYNELREPGNTVHNIAVNMLTGVGGYAIGGPVKPYVQEMATILEQKHQKEGITGPRSKGYAVLMRMCSNMLKFIIRNRDVKESIEFLHEVHNISQWLWDNIMNGAVMSKCCPEFNAWLDTNREAVVTGF